MGRALFKINQHPVQELRLARVHVRIPHPIWPLAALSLLDSHMDSIELTLVIPTFNERTNVRPLVEKIHGALVDCSWEVLFVDDSSDDTPDVIAALSKADPRISVLHRTYNRGGLAGAVVEGFKLARGKYVCVLDADLQHPPSRIPALLAEARAHAADVVIASRYVPGGSAGGLAGPVRHFASRGLCRLTQLAFR